MVRTVGGAGSFNRKIFFFCCRFKAGRGLRTLEYHRAEVIEKAVIRQK